ncbi:response regulator transcription factor [Mycobacterium antarcticum]|uniref:response regulator transcription factor n=1 Tax=Mycolicibacterium sp. TUM20984 TaxID=3023368 RepID=UPI0024E0912C|nr:response regulator transcription factor [Mycolicibacterium sp. TUM20984]
MRAPVALVVDDDGGVRRALNVGLSEAGLIIREATNGEEALRALEDQPPDVVVLDVAMPGMSGVEVVSQIRLSGRTLPVCMLSARDEVNDRVAGLAAGADDYVVKPFSVTELAARLHALVRLYWARDDRPLIFDDLVVETSRRVVSRAGRELDLTAREFDLLLAFARHPRQVLSRNQLLELVWGYTWEVDSNVVDVFVGYLRRKLEADGQSRVLATVRGAGFVFRP